MLIDICPDRQQLRYFVTGRSRKSSLDAIAEHLEICDECDANIATLDDESDWFINELKCPVPPFRRQDFATPKQLIKEHQTSARPSIADLPPELARIIDRMLAIDPSDRFSTPAEVADALGPFTINADVTALLSPKPKSTSEPDARKVSNPVDGRLWKSILRKKILVALVILAVSTFAALAVVFSLKTPYGTVEIETDDNNVKVSVSQAGREIKIINAASGWDIRLKEGKYDLSLKSGDDKFKLSNNTVTVSRDDKIVLRVTLKNTAVAVRGDPFDGNVALSSRGATVEGPAYYPQNLLDGKTTGYHGTRGWAQSVTPATWIFTLPREYPLRQIRLLLYDRDPRAFRYTIETSADGKKYEMVADHSEKWSRSWQILPCPGRPVRHIRMQCLDSTYNDRLREKGFFAVELEAYCYPPKPQRRFPGAPLPGNLEDLRRRSYMLEFSGKQAFVDIPKLRYDGSHPITFEAIVMSLYRGSIIADFSGAGLGLDVANGYCSFHVNDGREADNGYVRVKSTTSVARDKLVHIAGVLDGNKLRLFVDGKLQGTETIAEFNKSDFPFMIGADPGGQGEPTQFLNGFIDEVRVSNTARYDDDFAPPSQLGSDKHTLVLYRFDEGEGDVANDSSGNGLHGKIHSPKWVMAKAEPGTSDSSAIQRLRQIGAKITRKDGVVTEILLGNSPITDANMSGIESIASLESLTVFGCMNVTDATFARLKRLPHLRVLNIAPSNVGSVPLHWLRQAGHRWTRIELPA